MARKHFPILIFLISIVIQINCDPHCGYEACPKAKPKVLTVHLVPHTHDDVGWVRTVDEYFYGVSHSAFDNGVKTIIESVIEQLELDPIRKFIWVETSYLWKWWSDQKNETLRNKVKQLVATGQLELTGGAWSMNDEAVTHYQSTIDQFTWGFRRLSDIFGDCGRPHVGWQIDPFGHSRETASLMAQMGFDGLFFGRLDEDDKQNRMKSKTMEMIWRGSKNLGVDSDLFTGALFNQYSPPKGFCFDVKCSDYIDESPNGNFKEKISDFIYKAKSQAESFQTKNVLWTMGMDFQYTVARTWYTNLDVLIKHVNAISNETGIVAVYSTPSCYLQALHNANQTWPVKEDDFFPYASSANVYWTGYFTSRPNLKRFERVGNNLLQVCKQLHVSTGNEETENLISLREAMGVLQHHDAITGTEKQYVANDYAKILDMAIKKCDETNSEHLNLLVKLVSSDEDVELEKCPLLNISKCSISEKEESFVVTVYNPLARIVSKFVRLPVVEVGHKVVDLSSGKNIQIQYMPVPEEIRNLSSLNKSDVTHELIFEATDLPPLGFKSFHVKQAKNFKNIPLINGSKIENEISNEFVKIRFDEKSGKMVGITVDGVQTPINQQLLYYVSGRRDQNKRPSGAYIFRPGTKNPKTITEKAEIKIYKGPLVQEVHQKFSFWATQVIRIYKGNKHVEFEWLVGPIPTEDHFGKEVISRFSSNMLTNGEFKTDSNSREYLRRKRNYRASWEANIKEPVAGNYYPITSVISMQDRQTVVSVLTDRAQGGGSIEDGSLELMVHRRLVEDDGFGVDEVLDEREWGKGMISRGRHVLFVAPLGSNATARLRDIVQREMVLEPTLFFTPTNLSPEEWKQTFHAEFSGIEKSLPYPLNLLTLEPWKDGQILIRLEHVLEKDDDMAMPESAQVSLQELFSSEIESVSEMTLGANQKVADSKRFTWIEDTWQERYGNVNIDFNRRKIARNVFDASKKYIVILYPMQIRTFIIKFV
ncbi:lysosomal alpha-mannosidase-like [Neocloeon triangulifer]|uniref:lysosomal alpha-mannosidase-like n=1 Tax=Neocloeon triangulifer TaxID=2078957 RepID=UPI00286F1BB1|nr:lysosomal alpha-mannosidase-like [Neocloeon triangulifer]